MPAEREIVTTKEAARLLNLTPRTLRGWAKSGKGPIQPVRINTRINWRVDDIQALVRGER